MGFESIFFAKGPVLDRDGIVERVVQLRRWQWKLHSAGSVNGIW
jgi:hypothetical protein